jgi:hypothetical protein
MKKIASAFALIAILSLSAPLAAHAEDSDGYAPPPPVEPTLAGSTATGVCEKDAPWIFYDVVLVDPDEQATDLDAELVITGGSESVSIPLGTLTDNSLSGQVLWPGASVDDQGNATGWPGWAYENGQWVETSGNYAWTRGAITATIVVNPELVVPLSYPAATPNCANGPLISGETPAEAAALPATGGLGGALIPVAAVAALAVIGGATILVIRRRTVRR